MLIDAYKANAVAGDGAPRRLAIALVWFSVASRSLRFDFYPNQCALE